MQEAPSAAGECAQQAVCQYVGNSGSASSHRRTRATEETRLCNAVHHIAAE